MSQEDYNKKYLKYKAKYFALKNQIGGVVCPKCGKEPCECLPFINIDILLYHILQNFNPPYKGIISLAAIPQFRETIKDNLEYIIDTLNSKEPLFEIFIFQKDKDKNWEIFTKLCELLIFQETFKSWIREKYNKLTNQKKILILRLKRLNMNDFDIYDALEYDIEQLRTILKLVNDYDITVHVAFRAFRLKWSDKKINKYKNLLNRGLSEEYISIFDEPDFDDDKIIRTIDLLKLYPELSERTILEIVSLNMTPEQITSYIEFYKNVQIGVNIYLSIISKMSLEQKASLIDRINNGESKYDAIYNITGINPNNII
jgi:hypothetical protein